MDTPFDPKYVRQTTSMDMAQFSVYPRLPTDGLSSLVEKAVFDPSSRLLDYLRANAINDNAPTRSTRDSSGRDLGTGGESAFDHVVGMPVIDIGRDPYAENPERSIHKGSFFINFHCDEQPTDTIDYSAFDNSLSCLTPARTELCIFDYIHDENCLKECRPIALCAMAETTFMHGHEKKVISHSVAHHVEVLPASVDAVPAILEEANAKDILAELSTTQLYAKRVLSTNRPLAISGDTLFIIPVVVPNGSGYKVHYVPAINLTLDNIVTIKHHLNKTLPIPIQACFEHVYSVGSLLLPHRHGEEFWYVSFQVERF